MRLIFSSIFAGTLTLTGAAYAEVNCSDALVQDTYTASSDKHLNWAMAHLVTENQWKTISHDGSLNIVIYGVPVGASYKDFENNVQQLYQSDSSSLSKSDFENIAWTFLDPAGAKDYAACVEAQLNQLGLHLGATHATATDVAIKIAYRKHGREPNRIPVTWQWSGKTEAPLPRYLYDGETTIVIPRPGKEMNLAVNYQGIGDSITIGPLYVPPPSPQKPPPQIVNASVVLPSDSEPSGACGGWSGWYTLCSANEPSDWKLVASDFKLVGDRSCESFGHCNRTVDSPTQVCWQFQMQGHDEECSWHNNNTGIHNSQGVLTTVWAHPDTGQSASVPGGFIVDPHRFSPFFAVYSRKQ